MPAEGWSFHNPVSIRFAPGALNELPAHVSGTALIVTSRGATARGLTDRVAGLLSQAAIHDGVQSNPTIADMEQAITEWRERGIDTVVGIGGGSAIDTAKVLSLALAAPDLTVGGWLESASPWRDREPLPMVAIPTTAGTGSEVTPFATLWDAAAKRKHSVGTPLLHPRTALIDPALAVSLPWIVTLSTGLDAFSQCFESICNRSSTPLTTAIAERGLAVAPDALRALQGDLELIDARAAMAEAALESGLAISVTKTGLAHSMSYPLTAHLGLPHGLACALGLPGVLAFNAAADDGRLARVAGLLGLPDADAIAPWMLGLYRELGVPDLLRANIGSREALRALEPEMLMPGRSDTNMRPAGEREISDILDFTDAWLRDAGPQR